MVFGRNKSKSFKASSAASDGSEGSFFKKAANKLKSKLSGSKTKVKNKLKLSRSKADPTGTDFETDVDPSDKEEPISRSGIKSQLRFFSLHALTGSRGTSWRKKKWKIKRSNIAVRSSILLSSTYVTDEDGFLPTFGPSFINFYGRQIIPKLKNRAQKKPPKDC